MASQPPRTRLSAVQRIDLWEWLKANITQAIVDSNRYNYEDITRLASVKLGFDISSTSVEELLTKMSVKSCLSIGRNHKAAARNELANDIQKIKLCVRSLCAKLGEPCDV